MKAFEFLDEDLDLRGADGRRHERGAIEKAANISEGPLRCTTPIMNQG